MFYVENFTFFKKIPFRFLIFYLTLLSIPRFLFIYFIYHLLISVSCILLSITSFIYNSCQFLHVNFLLLLSRTLTNILNDYCQCYYYLNLSSQNRHHQRVPLNKMQELLYSSRVPRDGCKKYENAYLLSIGNIFFIFITAINI